jgi:hypothetical protein
MSCSERGSRMDARRSEDEEARRSDRASTSPTHHQPTTIQCRHRFYSLQLACVFHAWSKAGLSSHTPRSPLCSLPPTTSELLSLLSMRSLCCWHEAGEGGCVVGGARSHGSVAALSLLSLTRISPHLTRHFRMACLAYSLPLFLAFSLLSVAVATAYSRAPASVTDAFAPLCLDTHTPPTLAPAFLLLAFPTSDSLERECVDCGGPIPCRLFSRR